MRNVRQPGWEDGRRAQRQKNNGISESCPNFLQPDTHTPQRHLYRNQQPSSQPASNIPPAAIRLLRNSRATLLFRRSLFYNFLIVFAPNLCKIAQVCGPSCCLVARTCKLCAAYITAAMYNIWLNLISATQVNFDSGRVETLPAGRATIYRPFTIFISIRGPTFLPCPGVAWPGLTLPGPQFV